MFCRRCGSVMPDTVKFCSRCGAPAPAAPVSAAPVSGPVASVAAERPMPAEQPAPAQRPRGRRGLSRTGRLIVILALVAAFVVGMLAGFFLCSALSAPVSAAEASLRSPDTGLMRDGDALRWS